MSTFAFSFCSSFVVSFSEMGANSGSTHIDCVSECTERYFRWSPGSATTDQQTNGAISAATGNSEALGLFAYLQQNPLFLLTSLSMIFLVAGADAGTIVLGSMSAGGVLNPKRLIKLTWGAIMGALAAVLPLAGGLDALQNGAILAATPFAIL